MTHISTLFLSVFLLLLLVTCSKKSDPRPSPKAAFSWTNAGEGTVQFNDASTDADSYTWNFGDTSPNSTERNPTHTFAANGKFTVTLLVKNETGNNQLAKTVEVSSFAAPATSFSILQGDNGAVTLTSTSTNAQSYSWELGNGTTSTSSAVSVTYVDNRTYTVTLTATGRGGQAKTSQPVSVTSNKPTADFGWTESNGTVVFTNKSRNADSYSWEFGNGQTSVDPSPVNQRYQKTGSYAVKLTATNKAGISSKSATILISYVALSLADVVDDASWTTYLPGTWGVYVPGEEQKFDNYSYTFSSTSNALKYKDYYNGYFYLNSPQTTTSVYSFSLSGSILYTIVGDKLTKYARLEPVSDDEMKLYRILESASSYTELTPYLLTRTSDLELPVTQTVTNATLATALPGIWDQGDYSIYTNVYFDFSSAKNYYQYNYTYQGAMNSQKVEFKVDAASVMKYRNWNSDFNPAWKKYKVELVNPTTLRLYSIDASGKVATQPTYTLIKRT